MPKTILLKGDKAVQHEGYAKESLRPGKLVEFTGALADGAEGSLQAHATSSGSAVPLFVDETNLKPFGPENEYQAGLSPIEGTISAGDEAEVFSPSSGSVVYGWLTPSTAGNGEGTVAAGDLVESDGNGNLINSDSISEALGVAAEGAVNTSGTDAKRFKVMVI